MKKRVISKKPSIALKKFLKGLGYTVMAAVITYSLNYLSSMNVSPENAVMVGLLISVLQALKKALEKYDYRKDR